MNQPPSVFMNSVSKRRMCTSIAVISLALGAATLIGGCVSPAPQPASMRDPQADFHAYKTFGWDAAASGNASGQPLSILDSNIRAAIANDLKGKGYEEAAAGTAPDLIVSFGTARAEKVKNSPVRIGVGMGSWGGSSGGSVGVSSSGVKNVNEGTLVVHAIDRARNAEVWTGHVSRDLGHGNVEPALVQNAVAELLRAFPAHGGQP
ncbi:MAG TPA: DUF4136 domain-containing protein [Steroidobacteraceae bacterium]|nr:DUF4136 domain-containing protein [Steroidobacteraceae bacterium]